MTTQQNKIILVTNEKGQQTFYPYTLENLEKLLKEMHILGPKYLDVEIIKQG